MAVDKMQKAQKGYDKKAFNCYKCFIYRKEYSNKVILACGHLA